MKWLHLGLGNFHKAHQAWYLQKLNELSPSGWEIVAFSMQRPDAARELAEQNYRYAVQAVGMNDANVTQVRSITQSGFLQTDQALLLELARDPQMGLITLTVTEKGYRPGAPAIGALATILQHRTAPLTIVSCDNLQGNGHKLEHLVREQLGADFPTCAVSFPNSMVDRIVPASPIGAPIKTEHFCQWVIENKFVSERPLLEKVGVQLVSDVAPYELMKLRLLNAAHSFLAYAGLNRGLEFVHQAVTHPELHQRLLALWQETLPLLPGINHEHASQYVQELLTRFNNPQLPHRLAQIATDGSVKLPQRILPTLFEAQKRGLPHGSLAAVVDEWARAMSLLPADLFADPWRPLAAEHELKEKILARVTPVANS